jgi:hypothetical protein
MRKRGVQMRKGLSSLSVVLAGLVLGGIVGCGSNSSSDGGAPDSTQAQAKPLQNTPDMHIQSDQGTADIKGGVLTEKDKNGNSVQIGGDISEADLGVPFYPGSASTPGSFKGNDNGQVIVTSVRSTKDSPAQVIAFYKDRLGAPTTEVSTPTGNLANWDKGPLKTLVEASPSGSTTTINVTRSSK